MNNSKINKSFFLSISTLVLVLLGGVLLLANVQQQQDTRSRAGVNGVQVQCSQDPTVDMAFTFTNTESYPVDMYAAIGEADTDPSVELTNIAPGESKNAILSTGLASVSAGTLFIDWYPTDSNSTEQGGFEEKPFTALTCGSATTAPSVTTNPSVTTALTPGVSTSVTATLVPTSPSSLTPTTVPSAAKLSTDLNDDGNVNQFDYNLFIREISTQPGQ